MTSPSKGKPWLSIGTVLAIFLGLGLSISMMPKSFDMTHEKIGTGKPSLVFVYDPNLSVSTSQSEQMNIARDQLGDNAFFFVAKIGTPEGDSLIAKHRASPAELLLFDSSGVLIKRQFALLNANELVNWLTLNSP